MIDSTHAYAQVAVETKGTEGTSYLRGIQLIRQTRSGGTSTEDLLPMHGHLGTSLGAVNTDGNVDEQVDADAFGNLDQSTGLNQTHLYTGEYWDQDSQLVYLRARWYDPRVGRFISGDPIQGVQRDPRSLNRYSYASSDPMHRVDRSGKFNSSEISVTTNTLLSGLQTTSRVGVQKMLSRSVSRAVIGSAMGGSAIAVLAMMCYQNPKNCWIDIPLYVAGGAHMPETAWHIMSAQLGMGSNERPSLPILHAHPEQSRSFLDRDSICDPEARERFAQSNGGLPGICDEYPYSTSKEGGPVRYDAGYVSLRMVARVEQNRQGGHLGHFYNWAGVSKDGHSDMSKFITIGLPGVYSFSVNRAGEVHFYRP